MRYDRVNAAHFDSPMNSGLWGIIGVGIAATVVLILVPALARWSERLQPDKARDRRERFRRRGDAVPGELAANPAVLSSLDAGAALFEGTQCPAGHAWQAVAPVDTVRLGDDRITVLGRSCSGCAAKETRYVKLSEKP